MIFAGGILVGLFLVERLTGLIEARYLVSVEKVGK